MRESENIRRINNIEKKEKSPETLPKLEMKFVFLRHDTEEDAEILENNLKECDIFCHELLGWNREKGFKPVFDKLISKEEGISKLMLEKIKHDPDMTGFDKKMFELIEQYKKPIILVDIENTVGNKPLLEMMEHAESLRNLAFSGFEKGNFNLAKKKFREYLSLDSEFQIKREKLINKNIEEILPQILKEYPEFKEKKEIKTLFAYGGAHTSLFHHWRKREKQLKREGKLNKKETYVKREFPEFPYFYTFIDELRRRHRFHKEKFNKDIEITDEEVIKFVLNAVLTTYFTNLKGKPLRHGEEVSLSRFFLEKINRTDINELEKELKEKPLIAEEREPLKPVIEFFREKKGLPLPENKEELEELIKEIKPEVELPIKIEKFSKKTRGVEEEKIGPVEKMRFEIPEYLKPYLTPEQLAGKHAIFIKQIERAQEALLKKDPLLQETMYNEEKKDIRVKNFEQIWQKRWLPWQAKEGYFQSEKKESPFEQYSSKGWKIHIAFEKGKEKEIAQFLYKNGLFFKVEAGSGTYFNGLKESGATIYIGSHDNTQEIAESITRNIGEFLRDGPIAEIGDKKVKKVRVGSGSDIEILPKITARFDVAKTKFGWVGDKEEQEKRKKLGPREYKYSEFGLPSWSGLGGIPILSKYSKEESEITNTKRWNKASEAERRKYLERMKAIYEESKKELIKDFGAEFLLGKQK